MEIEIENSRLVLMQGDITKISVDAIVNAANSALAGGGGVDGAIHRAGGSEIMRELDAIRQRTGGCPTGGAVVTTAGRLPAKFIFHAVGPVYRDGKHGEPELLASCYLTCLQLADEHGAKTIGFPSISTGIYRYPIAEAAKIAVNTIAQYLKETATGISKVLLVQFSDADHHVYSEAAKNLQTGTLE